MSGWIASRGAPLRGDIAVPGDKSVSHRAIMLGAIAEGTTRVAGFLERHPEFTVKPIALDGVTHVTPEGYLRLTPYRAGTDGFFAAVLQRASYTP